MINLNHQQFKLIEWANTQSNQGGDHYVFCQTCHVIERVAGLEKVVEFINHHAGHQTCTRTFVNDN